MNRLLPLLVGLLLTAAAGPGKHPEPTPLPVPPIPPPHPPIAQSAPVPNSDVDAPVAASVLPNVTFRDFRATKYANSPGYAPGSQFETNEDKRTIQTPGLTWKVPLQ
jgi:hypothetical protein